MGMTEQEAIANLKSIQKEYEKKKFGVEALKMSIKALEKQIARCNMNVFDVLREKLSKLICHDNNRKTVYLEDAIEIVNQVEQEYNKKYEPMNDLIEYGVDGYNHHLKEKYRKGYEDGLNADKWIPCSVEMPPVETEVWIVAKRKWRDGTFNYIYTTAMYEDGTVLENDSIWRWEDIEGEWNEEEDCYIIPKGWWEWKHYNGDGEMNHAVDDEVIAWQPLPPAYGPKRGNRYGRI